MIINTKTNQNKQNGLSLNNRSLLVGLFIVALLLWGPIEPYGQAVRTGYLIALPILLWLGLGYFGNRWITDDSANVQLTRGVVGILAGVLFVSAYISFTAPYHSECTKSVQTRDGYECVGDYVSVAGRNLNGTFIFVGLGVLAAWYAISKHGSDLIPS